MMKSYKNRERSIYSIAFLIILSLSHYSCEESKDDALETDPKEVIIYDLELEILKGAGSYRDTMKRLLKFQNKLKGFLKGNYILPAVVKGCLVVVVH